MKKETLEDIVKITGYSKTTISRVLNGKGKEYRISEDTCEHIIKVAKDINYRPQSCRTIFAQGNGKRHRFGRASPE